MGYEVAGRSEEEAAGNSAYSTSISAARRSISGLKLGASTSNLFLFQSQQTLFIIQQHRLLDLVFSLCGIGFILGYLMALMVGLDHELVDIAVTGLHLN